jgi:hypothetical protein
MITKGPKHHWFGYYDKLEFDPTDRYVLGMEVDFEHRQPTPDDEISLGMVDLQDGDRWIEIGRTKAWCWQQGCMLQWVPGTRSDVIWNDREDGQFVSRILNVKTQKIRTLPSPIYALTSDGKTALSIDFSRLNDVRPGYGYVGISDQNVNELVPDKTGGYRVDMKSGEKQMLFSVAEIVHRGPRLVTMKDAKHYFIHLLANPYSARFILLHRWIGPQGLARECSPRRSMAATSGSSTPTDSPRTSSGATRRIFSRSPTSIPMASGSIYSKMRREERFKLWARIA